LVDRDALADFAGRVDDAPTLALVTRPVIPLDRALLCLDCDSVYEAAGAQTCPACGSYQGWAIGRALNKVPRGENE
jgi:hypothetical protein